MLCQPAGEPTTLTLFTKASELLEAPSTNARVMVMFTDGRTTAGPDPSPIAAAARAAGVVIYAIRLSGNNGVDPSALEDWASKPSSSYAQSHTPDDAELEELFMTWPETLQIPARLTLLLPIR